MDKNMFEKWGMETNSQLQVLDKKSVSKDSAWS